MTKKVCSHCRKRFTPGPRGRAPRYCSASCRQRAYEIRKFERALYERGPQAALDKDLGPLRARVAHAQGPLVLRTTAAIAEEVEKTLVKFGLLDAMEGGLRRTISQQVTNALLDQTLKSRKEK
ncbi:MAG: hypothetical protein WBX25_35705 [Rhodomicrobium sp.]